MTLQIFVLIHQNPKSPLRRSKLPFSIFGKKNSTVFLNMLGVEFEKIKNVTFLIYNEGTFFSKKDFQLHSSFKNYFLRLDTIIQGHLQIIDKVRVTKKRFD